MGGGHYAGKITCKNLQVCSALIYSDLRGYDLGYKHREGGGTREEGERGRGSRRLQAGEGVASAARSHDRTREKQASSGESSAATIWAVVSNPLR